MRLLESDRVYLKKMSIQDDLNNYLDMVNDVKNVNMITGLGKVPLNIDDLIDFIKNYDGQLLGIFTKDNQHVGNIGFSNFNQISRSCSYGIIMSTKFKRQGYALAGSILALNHVFQDLNLHRVYLDVMDSNAPAIKLYEKLGFQRDGRMRDACWTQGRYHDLYMYSLLKSEYKELAIER